DRDELHRLETHERAIQDEFNTGQAGLLEVQRHKLELEGEIARLTDHLESLRSEMAREGLAPDRSGMVVGFDEASAPAPEGAAAVQGSALLDLEETRARIEEVRRQIRRLGSINAEAPEDYEETKERFDFLTTQMADLADAEAQL